MKHYTFASLLLFCAFVYPAGSRAQTTSIRNKFPKALLVQLKVEQNRINALITAKKYKDAELVMSEAKKIREVTVNDFSANFDFCPVYYFHDSNFRAVIERKFSGVLFDATGASMDDSMAKVGDDFIIVYYGYANERAQSGWARDTSTSNKVHGMNLSKSLVVLNNHYKQRGFFHLPGLGQAMMELSHPNGTNYFYSSRKFDMEYFPLASDLNDKLRGRARRFHGDMPRRGE